MYYVRINTATSRLAEYISNSRKMRIQSMTGHLSDIRRCVLELFMIMLITDKIDKKLVSTFRKSARDIREFENMKKAATLAVQSLGIKMLCGDKEPTESAIRLVRNYNLDEYDFL